MVRINVDRIPLVLLIAVTMVTMTMPAMATHNSVGGQATIAVADEVNADGDLIPDTPPGSALEVDYHDHLDVARSMPTDQSGDRYTNCQGPGDVQGSYEDALRDGDACYIGFMDSQFEYLLATVPLVNPTSDTFLYPVNPAADDDHCRGNGDPATRVDRAVNDPECSGSAHNQFIPGSLAVDTDLLDAPFSGEENLGVPSAAEAVGTETGSGTLFWPFISTPYLYLFGQPHPDNPEPSEVRAGEGPFGADPASGGSPLFDLTGACGDRTQDCVLLTPEDIKLYDDNNGNLGGVEEDQARVCDFRPQFVTLNPDDRDAGLCGVFGNVFNQFLGVPSAGGLALPGVPGTWHNTLPGWYEGVLMLILGEPDTALGIADEYQCTANTATPGTPALGPVGLTNGEDCDGEFAGNIQHFAVVNPAVPTDTHPLWCVRPNILATGSGGDDPGFYGTYVADGIDSDVYRLSPFDQLYRDVVEATHEPVRGVLGPVEEAIGAPVDFPPDTNDLNDAVDTGMVTDIALEANDPVNLVHEWTRTDAAGIACDAFGVPQVFEESRTLEGDVIHNVEIAQTTVSLKDPAFLLDSEPLGAGETTEGAWMADQYSFSGSIFAFLDTGGDDEGGPDGEFSGCASANGQPQPDNDFCSWEALWDVYNPDCTDIDGNECGGIAGQNNYDLDEGVGLYFVWKISGPVVVTDEDLARPNEITERSAVLGLNDPTGQNCIVGFSIGLTEKLDADAIAASECGDASETLVLADAFNDQSASNRGGFSAAIDVLKLVPTPNDVIGATDIGAGDELCVQSVLNVVDGEVAGDTLDNIELTEDPGWSDCHQMTSTLVE